MASGTSRRDNFVRPPPIPTYAASRRPALLTTFDDGSAAATTGTADAQLLGIAGDAAGDHGETSTGAASLTSAAGASAGSHGVSGTGGAQNAPLSPSASGSTGPVGSAAGGPQPVQASGVGVEGETSIGIATLGSPSGSAAGIIVVPIDGSASGTLADPAGLGSGDTGAVGGGGAAVVGPAGDGSGNSGVAGSGDGGPTLPGGDGSGAAGYVGAGAGSLDASAPVGAAAGEAFAGPVVVGTGSATWATENPFADSLTPDFGGGPAWLGDAEGYATVSGDGAAVVGPQAAAGSGDAPGGYMPAVQGAGSGTFGTQINFPTGPVFVWIGEGPGQPVQIFILEPVRGRGRATMRWIEAAAEGERGERGSALARLAEPSGTAAGERGSAGTGAARLRLVAGGRGERGAEGEAAGTVTLLAAGGSGTHGVAGSGSASMRALGSGLAVYDLFSDEELALAAMLIAA